MAQPSRTQAERRLNEEVERVKNYLNATTEAKITRCVQTELVLNQMKSLAEMENSGLITMLRNDKYEDLSRMYHLFRHVQGGSQLIRTYMSDHVKEVSALVLPTHTKVSDLASRAARTLQGRACLSTEAAGTHANEVCTYHQVLDGMSLYLKHCGYGWPRRWRTSPELLLCIMG